MPIRHCIVHFIDKTPDSNTASCQLADQCLAITEALENLVADVSESYNAKPSKVWGYFQADQTSYPFSQWLDSYINNQQDFLSFSQQATEQLKTLMEASNLSIGGHVLFAHFQQGMTEYLTIALLHHSQGVSVTDQLAIQAAKHLDFSQLHLAARINLSEWQNNQHSKQYISFIKGKNGKKVSDYFRDFIGCQEGVDAPNETRTLLKAFSDFVENEDLAEEQAKEKTEALVDYANTQTRLGKPMQLDELSEVLDEDNPQAFYNYIRHKDYGLSPEIPADKKTLNQFRRFTGRAEGLSISFEAHLLGSKVEYDADSDRLIIHNLPTKLKDQLKRTKE